MTAWFAAAVLLVAGQAEPDPELARHLYHQALDQQAELNLDSTMVLLRAARDADPSSLFIHLDYMAHHVRWTPQGHSRMQEEYASFPDTPINRCLRAFLSAPPDYPAGAGPALLEMEEKGEGGGCPVVLLPGVLREMRPFERWDPERLEYYRRAIRLAPDASGLWTRYAETLRSLGRLLDAEKVLAEAALSLPHPIQRISLNMRRAEMIFLRGDTSRAVALQRALASAVDRDGRPGMRLIYLYELDGTMGRWAAGEVEGWATPRRRLAEFAEEHGAWNYEWQARFGLGLRASDRGEPLVAVEALTRAVAIADSVGNPSLQAQALYKRGRALGMLNRRPEAEADLHRALEMARSSKSPYLVAEAWHNLFQMNHDAGRLEDALFAADRFLEAADPLIHSSLRWAAHLAAGEIRWKLGWHAAANQAYSRAISVIDDHEEGHNYAGDYFERQGDLERAKLYFDRGTRAYGGGAESVRDLSWAGLARVYLELGQVDSAEAAADAHDRGLMSERGIPLLPWILAEEGRFDPAGEIASNWARARLEAGSLAGAATAHLQWAGLSLAAGNPETALEAARRADSLALIMNLVDEEIQARRLGGQALAALGDTAAAIRDLREAAGKADALSSAATFRSTHVALGEMLAAVGDTEGALSNFDKAAGQVLETTSTLHADLDRVRYRDRHLSPYDGAITALLQLPVGQQRIGDLVSWSQRRKGVALRLGFMGVKDGQRELPALSLDEVQDRLGETDAVVDYLGAEGSLWALVICKDAAVLRRLPQNPDSLAGMVASLTDPFSRAFGGRLDLARAPFDEASAGRLFRAVWEPFSDALSGIERVYLVPDGFLHRLPFAALVSTPQEGPRGHAGRSRSGPRYLLDDFELTYLPSLGFLPENSTADRAPALSSRVLIVAANAPGTEEEVARVSEAWGDGLVHVLSGAEASESRVMAVAGRHEILHFAAHAVADDRDPLASHLRLESDSVSDGLLHPVEIESSFPGHHLVVLSACETQLGKAFLGEGLMGLSRAFLSGRAGAAVGSQWLVGGTVGELMGDFYGQLSRGVGISTALRRAQLAARHRTDSSHPFFWAGFVLHLGGN